MLYQNIPGFGEVDDIDSIWACLPQICFHVHLQVLGSEVTLRRKQHLNVLRGGVEDGGEVCRARHDCRLDKVKFRKVGEENEVVEERR